MDAENLNDPSFIKFCNLVKDTTGESSTEVLYAWYFNTFDLQAPTTKPTTTKTTKQNEISKTK